MKKITFFTLFNLYIIFGFSQYFPAEGQWEEKDPKSLGFNAGKLNAAVAYALENEYTGEKDLRIAILKAFHREPYHEIKGPVKERGGPTGLIIKDGYVVA
ncbi:MAG: hypothetical protein ACNS60_10210 [Candidatus Cyclobacteriaceae bacterium M2_1C_046]